MASPKKTTPAPTARKTNAARVAGAKVVRQTSPTQKAKPPKAVPKRSPAKPVAKKTGVKAVKKTSRAAPRKVVSKGSSPATESAGSSWTVHVSLSDTKPLIWRRLMVPGSLTLGGFAQVLQAVMSWGGGHLHGFRVGGIEYGPARLADDDEMIENENSVTIASVLPKPKSSLLFVYDYGDDWQHEVVVEKITPSAPGTDKAKCLAGDRAAPPEDCGGIWGFSEVLHLFTDPTLPDPDGLRECIEDYDPAAFDLKGINEALTRLRI